MVVAYREVEEEAPAVPTVEAKVRVMAVVFLEFQLVGI
jgi:hypothetical protein